MDDFPLEKSVTFLVTFCWHISVLFEKNGVFTHCPSAQCSLQGTPHTPPQISPRGRIHTRTLLSHLVPWAPHSLKQSQFDFHQQCIFVRVVQNVKKMESSKPRKYVVKRLGDTSPMCSPWATKRECFTALCCESPLRCYLFTSSTASMKMILILNPWALKWYLCKFIGPRDRLFCYFQSLKGLSCQYRNDGCVDSMASVPTWIPYRHKQQYQWHLVWLKIWKKKQTEKGPQFLVQLQWHLASMNPDYLLVVLVISTPKTNWTIEFVLHLTSPKLTNVCTHYPNQPGFCALHCAAIATSNHSDKNVRCPHNIFKCFWKVLDQEKVALGWHVVGMLRDITVCVVASKLVHTMMIFPSWPQAQCELICLSPN